MNKINHIYSDTDWRPDFYYLGKYPKGDIPEKVTQFVEENIELGTRCFLNQHHLDNFGQSPHIHYIKVSDLKHDDHPEKDTHRYSIESIDEVELDELKMNWSYHIDEVVYQYHAMYSVLQIVHHMGFDQIYFVGCDLGYGTHKPHIVSKNGLDPAQESYEGKTGYLKKSFKSQHTA